MDLRARIASWEQAIEENPAIFFLGVVVFVAVAFFAIMYIDSYRQYRRRRKHRR